MGMPTAVIYKVVNEVMKNIYRKEHFKTDITEGTLMDPVITVYGEISTAPACYGSSPSTNIYIYI